MGRFYDTASCSAGAPDRAGVPVALAILLIAAATIGGAWLFEAFGYAPCELCLAQRWPYYAGVPLAGFAVLTAFRGPRRLLTAAFIGLALIFGASALFGAYHSGIEWGFWPGPKDCSGPLDQARTVEEFLKELQSVRVVRCDAPALRILGVSLAGWNAVISAGLAVLSGWGLSRARQ